MPTITPAADEHIVFEGHPSWRATLAFYIKGIIGALVLLAAIAGVTALIGDTIGTSLLVVIGLVEIVLVLVGGYVWRMATTYTITNRRLHIKRGIVARKTQEARLERVQNVNTEQSVIERMLRQEEHLLARLSLLQPEGDQTPRVFISYSHRDQNFVCQLANDLKRNRIYSWMDQREIGVGSIWSEQVELALDACEIMVVVLSPESAESPNVADEWHYYLDAEKTIVPVLYRDCHIPFRLKRIQYVDFVRHSYEDGLASLIDVLLEKLGPPGCLSVDIED